MRRVLASVAAATIALVGAIALAGPSTAQDPPLPDAGTITLKTSSSSSGNKIVYRNASGELVEPTQMVERTQTITGGCPATVSAGALAITGASTEGACFGNRGFGDGPNGSPFYLNPNVTGTTESLTLSLSGDAAELEFTSFSLDIEASNLVSGADISVTATLDGDIVGEFPVDLTAEPPTGVFANYRVLRPLATPADTLVLRSTGTPRFQLEGDTNSIGSIFELTDIGTIPAGGDVVLEDVSGATATIINPSGQPIPFISQDCTDGVDEPCVRFKLLTEEYKRLQVWVSVPLDLDTQDLQDVWQTEIDFLEANGPGFELGQLGLEEGNGGCKINEDREEQQACVLEFLYPDKPGDDMGNPELLSADGPVSSRLWDLWIIDPKLR